MIFLGRELLLLFLEYPKWVMILDAILSVILAVMIVLMITKQSIRRY